MSRHFTDSDWERFYVAKKIFEQAEKRRLKEAEEKKDRKKKRESREVESKKQNGNGSGRCSDARNSECLTNRNVSAGKCNVFNKRSKALAENLSSSNAFESVGSFNRQRINSRLNRNVSKSSDLDDYQQLFGQSSHLDNSVINPSVTPCNLSEAQSVSGALEQNFNFTEFFSFVNLLETDVDSGCETIYQPLKVTEIDPTVEFSRPIVDVNKNNVLMTGSTSLEDQQNSRSLSIPKFEITNSVMDLNIPGGSKLLSNESSKSMSQDVQYFSLPNRSSNNTSQYKSLPNETVKLNSSSDTHNPFVLPSQTLRNSATSVELQPITVCKAREVLSQRKNLFSVMDSVQS